MSSKKEEYEKALAYVNDLLRVQVVDLRGVDDAAAEAINAYVKELEDKAVAPQKMRVEKKAVFTAHLDLVHRELPRSKASADSCASITAYVDELNTEFEKMCAEMITLTEQSKCYKSCLASWVATTPPISKCPLL